MKKLGIALIAILLSASLLVACTPGYTLDRLFSFLGGSATDGNAYYYSTYGNYIYVSNGNIVSYGNAASSGNAAASSGNAAAASSGNATPASNGNAAAQTGGTVSTPRLTPSPVPHN